MTLDKSGNSESGGGTVERVSGGELGGVGDKQNFKQLLLQSSTSPVTKSICGLCPFNQGNPKIKECGGYKHR